jgi:hypothetical protein
VVIKATQIRFVGSALMPAFSFHLPSLSLSLVLQRANACGARSPKSNERIAANGVLVAFGTLDSEPSSAEKIKNQKTKRNSDGATQKFLGCIEEPTVPIRRQRLKELQNDCAAEYDSAGDKRTSRIS